MKKLLLLTGLSATLALGGCATSHPVGGLYTELDLPVAATANSQGTKTGTASCQSILGLVAVGDCSITAAKMNGNIDEVTHIDWHAKNILGIIGNYELTVHGN